MPSDRLLAKSQKWGEPRHDSMSLTVHLADVHAAAQEVLNATEHDQLQALGLSAEGYRERFRRIVLLAAAVHDLGKANDHFQGMIRGLRDVRVNPQGIRHEWVTLLMLRSLRGWLLPAVAGSELDFDIVEWVVAGHHPALGHASPPKDSPSGSGPAIELLTGHNDFQGILAWLEQSFGCGPAAATENGSRSLCGSDSVFIEIGRWFRKSQQTWDQIRKRPEARLVAAAKDALIAADIAGSALPKAMPGDARRWSWIAEAFASKPRPGDLQGIVDHRLGKGGTLREFQQAVGSSKQRVTFVKAGCGSGKTLAAYLWAANNHPARRLYFCYPTTGTATEGFKDYLFEPDGELGSIGANLFHSRRDIDFEIILSTGKDAEAAEADAAARLDSLEAWSTPIVACTVDTVLGLIQNNRRGLFAWPALAQAAFVFDEIHAYDPSLFGTLLRFLKELPHLPVLLMTASLPAAREEALRRVAQELPTICGPEDLETRPRYRKATTLEDNLVPLIGQTLERGGKVLWVCNTVGRVMAAAESMREFGPLLYHSRFKYEDRVQRHRDVIEAFDPRKNAGQALAICSQVAEMSLDLSADLLVTDLAPVPSLIQRLGRLNRRAKDGDPTRPFLVIEPDGPLPYTAADLDAARIWLGKLDEDGISQRKLASMWEQSSHEVPRLVESTWLDGGPETKFKELREASPGITVLMVEDQARVRARPRDLGRLVLPMPAPPRSMRWQDWPKERGLPVAPAGAILYLPMRGAIWQN